MTTKILIFMIIEHHSGEETLIKLNCYISNKPSTNIKLIFYDRGTIPTEDVTRN